MRNRDILLIGAAAGVGAAWGLKAWLRARRRIELRDRVVVVTGASSGHGLILARQAAGRGAHLVLAARSLDQLRAAEPELLRLGAASVLSVATDVTDEAQVGAMVDQTIARHGRVDVLVNNAGVIGVGPVETMTLDDFRAAMATNFWGAVYTTLAVLPHMRERGFGRIGNVVSIGGKAPAPHLVPYTASKFALTGFTAGLRPELVKDNIFVTGIYPSTMRTGGHTHAWFKGNQEAEYVWFALADSVPGLASSAETVAHRLLEGLCNGQAEVYSDWFTFMATAGHNLFPNLAAETLSVVNGMLPGPEGDGDDMQAVQGQNLRGQAPGLLNRVVPAAARPGGG